MFSKAGDRACHSLVKKVIKKVNGNTKVTKDSLDAIISEGLKKIAEKHGEVNDTEPESNIEYNVNKALKDNGYSIRVDRFDW